MKSLSIAINNRCNKQQGMTLLEVLVSMLIIGLGLAMTISMMQASSRYGASAEYRSAAMNEIQSIMDRMRSNTLGADGYIWGTPSYQNTYNKNIPLLKAPTTCSPDPCEETEKLKNAAQGIAYSRAQADMTSWLGHVATSLPGGQAAIERDGNRAYKVTVMWIYGDESSMALPTSKNTDSISMTFPI